MKLQVTAGAQFLVVIWTALAWLPASGLAQSNAVPFAFPDRGGASLTTSGTAANLGVGYARLVQTGATPAGFAVFGLRQGSTLVSEVTVPAGNLVHEGRIYAETSETVRTGIAIANPGDQSVQIGFYFTDASGLQSGSDVLVIPARGQIARFLNEAPFNGASPFLGTFTFFLLSNTPDLSIGATALRGFMNERGEFLMTTSPVSPVGGRGSFSGDVLPHFASGAGWSTQLILINPTDHELAGQAAFRNQAGNAVSIGTDLGTSSTFNYRISPRSSWRLRTSSDGNLQVGSVRLSGSPADPEMPVGFLIFAYRTGNVTVTSAGVPTTHPAAASRLFIESSGQFNSAQAGSIQSGLAIANASGDPVTVTLDLLTLVGTSAGLHAQMSIPANGQTASFLNQIPGFEAMPQSFQGVLRIAGASAVSVTGLRARYNERGDFIVTTTPIVDENDPYFDAVLKYSSFVFPHFVDGGGYTTQFVLFSGWNAGPSSGTLEFFSSSGQPLPISLK